MGCVIFSMLSLAADFFCKLCTRSCRQDTFSRTQSAASVLTVAAVDLSTATRSPSAAVAVIHHDSAYLDLSKTEVKNITLDGRESAYNEHIDEVCLKCSTMMKERYDLSDGDRVETTVSISVKRISIS